MSPARPATLVASLFLSLIALLHLARLLLGVEVLVEGTTVPMWLSVFGVIGPAALSVWLWRERGSAPVSPNR